MPKVGKVYSIVNALAELSDDERGKIQDLDHLFSVHQKEQNDEKIESIDPVVERRKKLLASIPGVVEVVVLSKADAEYIQKHESRENE